MFWKILQYWQRRRAQKQWLLFVCGMLGLTFALSLFNGLGSVDRLLADVAARLDGRTPSSDIVIVAIDDDSIRTFDESWPWSRDRHAVLLDRLKEGGARAVGLDILFVDPVDDPRTTHILVDSIKKNAPVVLPILVYPPIGADGWVDVLTPVNGLADVAHLAHINIQPDFDGVARSIYLREGRNGLAGGVWEHFALALWRAGGGDRQSGRDPQQPLPGLRASQEAVEMLDMVQTQGVDGKKIIKGWLQDNFVLISFAGPPGSFQSYSYMDVYFGLLSPEVFQDKYVLVGYTATGHKDLYSTPMAGSDSLMSGVEIIANVLDGVLQKEFRYPASFLQNIIYNIALMLLAIPLFYLGRARSVFLGIGSLLVLDLVLMFVLRRYGNIQVAPAASLMSLALAYPLWSWYRLEKAMRQIHMEFSRMRRENGFFQAPSHVSGDRLERDLQAFENASWQMRELQQMVRQSMDGLPYILLLANQSTQVILSNMQARQFFCIDPPLPTMAFEPAMGRGATENSPAKPVPEHLLASLLATRFMGSLLEQKDTNTYANELLLFLQQRMPYPKEGTIEVTDTRNGESYLLKIVPRIVTIERSQGWIISLVNLAGAQRAELQRNQILRYLQGNICDALSCINRLLKSNEDSDVIKAKTTALQKQINEFVEFEYAQTALYLYESVDLEEIFIYVYEDLAKKAPLAEEKAYTPHKTQLFLVRGDAQMLYKALTSLALLMMHVSGGEKMPNAKVMKAIIEQEGGDSTYKTQVFLMIALPDPVQASQKAKIFQQPIEYANVAADIAPEVLTWWSVQTTIARHAASIKVQKSERSLGVIIEFIATKGN